MAVEVTTDDFDSLGAKIDGLDLTEAESAILSAILAQATEVDDEVGGYAQSTRVMRPEFGGGARVVIDVIGAGGVDPGWGDRMKIVIIGDTAG